MNEGVGSTTIIVIIMVFVTFVSAYMAYNVNYTKAFRMKNKIIAEYEKYNGECNSTCENEIKSYSSTIGYEGTGINCDDNFYKPTSTIYNAGSTLKIISGTTARYCIYKLKVDNQATGDIADVNKDAYYYRVVTRIDIKIPIIQNVLQLQALKMKIKVVDDRWM